MSSDVVVVSRKSYFDMKRFEDTINNKPIMLRKFVAKRKALKVIDKILIMLLMALMLTSILLISICAYKRINIHLKNAHIAELRKELVYKMNDNKEIVEQMKENSKYDTLKMKAYFELNMITPTDKNIIYFDKETS